MRRSIMLSCLGVLLLGGHLFAQTVSFESLIDDIIDRDNLARFPVPAYTCSQASSYDRGSVAPDKPGWFANMDRSYFVRTEEKNGRKEYVLMDVAGPGSVVRMWATWHGPRVQDPETKRWVMRDFSNGTLRFYLDGAEKPVIEGPIASIIDGGGLVTGPLAEGVSPDTEYGRRGHNLYLPIPYASHCKVTYETDVPIDDGAKTGEALYYQINYRTYAQGTQVRPFTMQQISQYQDRIEAVQKRLAESGIDEDAVLKSETFGGTLKAGQTKSVTIDRPGAIRQLTVKLKGENQRQALRSTVLAVEFDGIPAVWCPVGAFFGRGYMSDPHRTWYTEVTDSRRMSCFWVMPFAKQCKISLINLSDQDVEIVEGTARLSDWAWDDRSMHFHGSWRQLTNVSSFREGADRAEDGAFDVNYVEVNGQGVYVGDTLTIFNGTDAWWGEGDEKIYVDGEAFPSHIGTGTEDYYGYAWCRPEFFQSPFHAQPTGAGNFHPGFSVNSRYRALDAIPFTKSIKFDMELWHWRKTTVNFAPTAFWYARPGASSNVKPDPETAAKPVMVAQPKSFKIVRVKGALEGEQLKIVEKTGGVTENQRIAQFQWSNGTQLWWKFAKKGDRLVLEFPVVTTGRYDVVARLTKANDYAIVDISINNGQPGRFDRYNPEVASDKLDLGTYDLRRGANRLTVEIAGANDKALPSNMFGLDYLLLIPKS